MPIPILWKSLSIKKTGSRFCSVNPARSSPGSADCRPTPPHALPRSERRFVRETWGAPEDRQEEWAPDLGLLVGMLRISDQLIYRYRKRYSPKPHRAKEQCDTAYGLSPHAIARSHSDRQPTDVSVEIRTRPRIPPRSR